MFIKKVGLLLCSGVFALVSLTATARGPGGGGGGPGGSWGGGATATGGGSGSHGGTSRQSPAGPADSSRADENANGKFATDQKRGLDRAQERMSEEGLQHQRATDNVDRSAGTSSKRAEDALIEKYKLPPATK